MSAELREVVDTFAGGLGDGWEYYLRPHLNGLRPDAVLLHDYSGVTVLVVDDWSPAELERYVPVGRDRDGQHVPHPFNELMLYAEEFTVRFSHGSRGTADHAGRDPQPPGVDGHDEPGGSRRHRRRSSTVAARLVRELSAGR